MIGADEARRIAREALAEGFAGTELADWPQGTWGAPVLVRNLAREPSYWLVPFLVGDRAAGFARVLPDGRVLAIGAFGRPGRAPGQSSRVVTGVSMAEAQRLFDDCTRLEAGERPAPPVFVHDGPPGREVWLVETTRDGRPCRWVFVSAAGCYERPAGTTLAEGPE